MSENKPCRADLFLCEPFLYQCATVIINSEEVDRRCNSFPIMRFNRQVRGKIGHECIGTLHRTFCVARSHRALHPGTTAKSNGHQTAKVGTCQSAAARRRSSSLSGRNCRMPRNILNGAKYANQLPRCGVLINAARQMGNVGSDACAARTTIPPMLNPSTLTD